MRLAAKPFITELIALLPPCTAALGCPSSLTLISSPQGGTRQAAHAVTDSVWFCV